MRGEIRRLTSDRHARGHEQKGPRFAVLLQSDDYPRSTVVVAPTSRSAAPGLARPVIDIDGTATTVLVEQLAAVDLSRLGNAVGVITRDEQVAIERALTLLLDLS